VTDAIRAEVAAWLDATWDPERPLAAWRDLLADSGWGAPTWPLGLYGRGLPRDAARVVDEEFDRLGAVGAAAGSGMSLAAPTILEHADDDLQRRLLRGILTGQDRWCHCSANRATGRISRA
jgi:alkylation response protein AidB-like acyl-CoA dehydrogenase